MQSLKHMLNSVHVLYVHIVLYCSSLWASYDSKCLQRLKVAYNNVFRKLLNIGHRESVSFHMTTRGIDAFPVIMRKYIVSFWKCLDSSNNCIIKSA